MKYLSICSGIEAATVAWEPLGWEAVGFSEIDAFPRAVLAHHYPHVPLHGDFTDLIERPPVCDVLVGGTPCQAFSVAGSRRSLADARGNLTLAYVMLADAIDRRNREEGKEPCIAVWENVPGVFSTSDNAFGAFLRGLAGGLSGEDGPLEPAGGKWTNAGLVLGPTRAVCWRVLDAQYFGVAQRRRRVFVVASAREGFDPSQVLLEWEGVRRDSAPSREARQNPASSARRGASARGDVGAVTTGDFPFPQDVEARSHWDGDEYPHPTLNQSFNTGAIGYSNQELFSQRGAGLVSAGRVDLDDEDPHAHLAAYHYPDAGEGYDEGWPATSACDEFVEDTLVFDTTQITSPNNYSSPKVNDPCHPLAAGAHAPAIVQGVALRGRAGGNTAELTGDIQPALRTGGGVEIGVLQPKWPLDPYLGGEVAVALDASYAKGCGGTATAERTAASMVVRRLTPRECERLQGFPDDYTLISWKGKPAVDCPDGPRYKALGNSMAVPCMAWIGRRIAKETA